MARPRHRGPHPRDATLFAPSAIGALQTAVEELSWLLGRGYAPVSAVKLVGDRHALRERQRRAIGRAACSDEQRRSRQARRIERSALAGERLAVDGFNCIIAVEAALAGGVLLGCRDGALRDLASVHGSYRRVDETRAAIELLGRALAGAAEVVWLLDRPVSNSGRLAEMLRAHAAATEQDWRVELLDAPDPVLAAAAPRIVASTDSWILDRCDRWIDLAAAVTPAGAWVVDLG